MSKSIIDGADFTGSDLRGVNFSKAYLGNCIFRNCYMDNTVFMGDEKPELQKIETRIIYTKIKVDFKCETVLVIKDFSDTYQFWNLCALEKIFILSENTTKVEKIGERYSWIKTLAVEYLSKKKESFIHSIDTTSEKYSDINEGRNLVGGDIDIHFCQKLSSKNKLILFSYGAACHDPEFVEFCESNKVSTFQARWVSECYEYGIGAKRDMNKMVFWLREGEDYQKLLKYSRRLPAAFYALYDLSLMKDNGKFRYPEAVQYVNTCYEKGWYVRHDFGSGSEILQQNKEFNGISRVSTISSGDGLLAIRSTGNIHEQKNEDEDLICKRVSVLIDQYCGKRTKTSKKQRQMLEIKLNLDPFEALESLVRFKYDPAFHLAQNFSEMMTHENQYKYPQALSIVGLCYENGWITSENKIMALTYFVKARDFTRIKRLAENRVPGVYNLLVLMPELNENENGIMRYPEAGSILGLLYESGQGVELNQEEAARWYSRSLDLKSLLRLSRKKSRSAIHHLTEIIQDEIVLQYIIDNYGNKESFCLKKTLSTIASWFETGWIFERDIQKAVDFYAKAENFTELRRLIMNGNSYSYKKIEEFHARISMSTTEETSISLLNFNVLSIMGECCENGWIVAQDVEKAIDYYRRARNFPLLWKVYLKNAKGVITELKNRTMRGDKISFQYMERLSEIESIENGNITNLAKTLSECYKNGWGVAVDDLKSENYLSIHTLFEKMYEKGLEISTNEIHILAGMVEKNFWFAFSLLLRIAECKVRDYYKFPKLFDLIGECYSNGWCVKKSTDEFAYWTHISKARISKDFDKLKLMAMEGSKDAFVEMLELFNSLNITDETIHKNFYDCLAECYENGWSVEKNLEKSLQLYYQGRNIKKLGEFIILGNYEALDLLIDLSGKQMDGKYIYPEAISQVGYCFEKNWIVKRDLETAVEHYVLAENERKIKKLLLAENSNLVLSMLEKTLQQNNKFCFEFLHSMLKTLDKYKSAYLQRKLLFSIGKCYEKGWVVEKDEKIACDYYEQSESFNRLKTLLNQGSNHALETLKRMAETRIDVFEGKTGRKGIGQVLKYSEAVSIMAEWYENRAAAEKLSDERIIRILASNDIPKLIFHARGGCLDAFIALKISIKNESLTDLSEIYHMTNATEDEILESEEITHTGGIVDPKSQARSLIGECYENGWIVEKNMKKAIEWYVKVKGLEKLKILFKKGNQDAIDYMTTACKMGCEESLNAMKELYYEGSSDSILSKDVLKILISIGSLGCRAVLVTLRDLYSDDSDEILNFFENLIYYNDPFAFDIFKKTAIDGSKKSISLFKALAICGDKESFQVIIDSAMKGNTGAYVALKEMVLKGGSKGYYGLKYLVFNEHEEAGSILRDFLRDGSMVAIKFIQEDVEKGSKLSREIVEYTLNSGSEYAFAMVKNMAEKSSDRLWPILRACVEKQPHYVFEILQKMVEKGSPEAWFILKESAPKQPNHVFEILKEMVEKNVKEAWVAMTEMAANGFSEALGYIQQKSQEGCVQSKEIFEHMKRHSKENICRLKDEIMEGSAESLALLKEVVEDGSLIAYEAFLELALMGIRNVIPAVRDMALEGSSHGFAILKSVARKGSRYAFDILKEFALKGLEDALDFMKEMASQRPRDVCQILLESSGTGSEHALYLIGELCKEGSRDAFLIIKSKALDGSSFALNILKHTAENGSKDSFNILRDVAKKGSQEATDLLAVMAQNGVEDALESLKHLASLQIFHFDEKGRMIEAKSACPMAVAALASVTSGK